MSNKKISELGAADSSDLVSSSLLHLVNPNRVALEDRNRKLDLSLAKSFFSEDSVPQTGPDGAALLPVGDDSERPTPSTGMLRFNTDSGGFEGYDGSAWGAIGGGSPADDASAILATQVFG